jgi:ribose 5-phosphate isomerase B
MITVFIGADHRGFELKNELVEYLQEKNIRVEDMGAYEFIKTDDASDFSHKVAMAVLQNPEHFRGIVICGSGAAVDIAANRTKGIRCSIGFNNDQVFHMRGWDDINVLALGADFISADDAKRFVDTFVETEFKAEDRMIRRNKQFDKL